MLLLAVAIVIGGLGCLGVAATGFRGGNRIATGVIGVAGFAYVGYIFFAPGGRLDLPARCAGARHRRCSRPSANRSGARSSAYGPDAGGPRRGRRLPWPARQPEAMADAAGHPGYPEPLGGGRRPARRRHRAPAADHGRRRRGAAGASTSRSRRSRSTCASSRRCRGCPTATSSGSPTSTTSTGSRSSRSSATASSASGGTTAPSRARPRWPSTSPTAPGTRPGLGAARAPGRGCPRARHPPVRGRGAAAEPQDGRRLPRRRLRGQQPLRRRRHLAGTSTSTPPSGRWP